MENIPIPLSLALVVCFGMTAQWLAWRLRLPSILLLLVFGFLAGSTELVVPDELLGKDLLFPVVSLFVSIILFEGGLSLRVSELREVGGAVRNLISIGVVITWLLTTAAALILRLDLSLALLFGAILTVTGPTVIGPLLRHVRPSGRVASVLKWEGIVNDPIGAMLALLVFEAIIAEQATAHGVLFEVLKTVVVGVGIGFVSAGLLIALLRRYLIPDYLHNPSALALAVIAFAAANVVQHESGLFAATVMGIVLANQKAVNIKHIVEFKENLRVLLISTLFILLGARIKITDLYYVDWRAFTFLAMLMLVIRPATVFLSTLRSGLSLKERLFLAWMAPRGVVAAAVASVFAPKLVENGIPRAESLVPLMFIVIIGTVAIYGMTAAPLAHLLKLAHPNPQGLLIVGAVPWVCDLGKALQKEGFRVLLVDTNWEHISAARMAGLPTFYGSALSEVTLDELDLEGIGRMLALTPNDEVNSLVSLHFSDDFGRSEVYQLAPADEGSPRKVSSASQRGRLLFRRDIDHNYLEERLAKGATIKVTSLTEEFDFKAFEHKYFKDSVPLFLIKDDKLSAYTVDIQPKPEPGCKLIALVEDDSGDREETPARKAT